MWNCRLPLSRRSSDGPDNMALTVNGQNSTSFPAGTNLTMLCSAQSNPPAQLQWAVRGELVNATSHLLELSSVNQGQSGEYTCLAFNNHTDMKSSVTKHIVIAGRSVCTVTSATVFIHLDSIFTLAESPQSCQDVNNRPSTCGSSACCYCLDSSNCQACYDNAKMIEFMVPYKAPLSIDNSAWNMASTEIQFR